MFGREYTYIFILLVVIQGPIGSNGETNSICYIKKTTEQSDVCVLPSDVMCCKQQLSVDRIEVYGRNICNTSAKCGDGEGCCLSHDFLNVSADYVASLNRTFKTTNCFNDVSKTRFGQLPDNSGLVSVIVSFSCKGRTTAATNTLSTQPQQTSVQVASTSSIETSPTKPTTLPAVTTPATKTTTITTTTDTSSSQSDTGDDSKTNVAAAVAIPVVIVLIIAGVLAAVFFIRRRQAANKGTHQSVVEPNTFPVNGPLQKSVLDYRHDSALPPSYDEGVNSDYAEIGGNRNSNLFGESNEYNTISPRHLPVTNGQIPTGQQATNEDYDHIGVQSPGHSKGTDTYAHIDHSVAKRLNVSNGGVVTDTSLYAHAAHNAQPRQGANTVDVGGDTYAHVDHAGKQRQAENTRFNGGDTYAHVNHGALQEHDGNMNSNTYDSTSTSGVRQEGGQYASEESQYDHTDHNAPNGSIGPYQDGGDYSHVGNLSTRRQREDDRTVTSGNQNQSLISGTKKQNDQNSDQHSYFVLEKQFK